MFPVSGKYGTAGQSVTQLFSDFKKGKNPMHHLMVNWFFREGLNFYKNHLIPDFYV
jgi:hypothetical protein